MKHLLLFFFTLSTAFGSIGLPSSGKYEIKLKVGNQELTDYIRISSPAPMNIPAGAYEVPGSFSVPMQMIDTDLTTYLKFAILVPEGEEPYILMFTSFFTYTLFPNPRFYIHGFATYSDGKKFGTFTGERVSP